MRFMSIIVTVLAIFTFPHITNADDTAQRSPELQVLDRFVGTWNVVVTTKLTNGESVTEESVENRKWSPGGGFVQFETSQQGKPELPESHLLVTYDPATKSYPGVLMSGPARALVTGSWDERSKTMTFRGVFADGGGKFTFKNKFIDAQTVETSGAITDPDGKIVVEQSHKQSRRNK